MRLIQPLVNERKLPVVNQVTVSNFQQSIQLFLNDRRKVISTLLVALIPIIENSWRIIPPELSVAHYASADIFVWTFSINLLVLIVSIAWTLSLPRRDTAFRYVSLSAVAYSTYLVITTLPITSRTPYWIDIVAASVSFGFVYLAIQYIRTNYLERSEDYKMMHDGIVHDLHHKRFLGVVNRIAGTLEVAQMDQASKEICQGQVQELKESIAYVSQKYEALH